MAAITQTKKAINGGEFLIRETAAHEIFIPEEFNEEQKMIAQTCRDFLKQEVYPRLNEIDSQKDPKLMPSLLDKAGELGLLGTSVPQELGGFGMDFNTTMLVAEVLGAGYSFAVGISAHTGIGTLPILYYGNEAQKKKYIPKLASGQWKAAYCLTEPDSGSDANSGKTKAVLTADGKHYRINGQKMWITNGGFADVFVVFAKIDNDKNLSAFIVEKSFGGITMNEEEKKMGIKGSSTRQIFFNDCNVPVANLLSERENGFKLADMTTRIFASESAHYRASQNIDDAYHALVAGGMDSAQARLKSLEGFAIECAILKVHGSEVLDFTVDEGVQIYGGMNFSAEGPMDRAYRDARINRIFEGTNEINRLLTIDMLMKRAMKGAIDLMTPAMAAQKELVAIPDFGASDNSAVFAKEKKAISNLKKTGLIISGAAAQKFMAKFADEQEILMNLSDILIEIYAAESCLLRVEKLISMRGEKACEIHKEMAMIYLHQAVEKATSAGKQAIYGFAEGDELRLMLLGLKRFTKIDPYNLKEARRKVANHAIEKGE